MKNKKLEIIIEKEEYLGYEYIKKELLFDGCEIHIILNDEVDATKFSEISNIPSIEYQLIYRGDKDDPITYVDDCVLYNNFNLVDFLYMCAKLFSYNYQNFVFNDFNILLNYDDDKMAIIKEIFGNIDYKYNDRIIGYISKDDNNFLVGKSLEPNKIPKYIYYALTNNIVLKLKPTDKWRYKSSISIDIELVKHFKIGANLKIDKNYMLYENVVAEGYPVHDFSKVFITAMMSDIPALVGTAKSKLDTCDINMYISSYDKKYDKAILTTTLNAKEYKYVNPNYIYPIDAILTYLYS